MHTKEPWEYRKDIVYLGRDGGFCLRDSPNPNDNARRIVACVNACAGIPTEFLEAGNSVSDAVRHFQTQRDELLAALKEVRKWIGDGEFSDDTNWKFWSKAYSDIVHHVDEAIAKADLTQ